MKPFEEIKEEILKRGREHHACQSGYAKAYKATNKIELLNAITANWYWCLVTTRMIDATFLEENFTEKELSEAGIYTRGTHEAGSMAIFACGNSMVKAYDNSTVEAYGSSTVEAYDNSTVKACGSSTVKAYGSSTVEAYDNSTVKACDNSTVKAYGSSYINDATGKCTRPDACAIVRDYHNRKIYIKKGVFEIIEVE